MQYITTDRGFRQVLHPEYASREGKATPVVAESCVIGEYDDSMTRPGSSYLLVRSCHHLNRQEVAELVAAMQHWLDTRRLPETLSDLL